MSTRGDRARAIRNRGLWFALRAGQRLGVDLTPHHFYSNTPDLRVLRASDHWRTPRSMTGVRGADTAEQAAVLKGWVCPEISEYLRAHDVHGDACAENGAVGYGRTEADLLYAFAAARRPARVVQVGSGVSTAVLLRSKHEHGLDTDIVCVDPYPTAFLRYAARRGLITLIEQPAQVVALETFTALGDGDLLFIDSTHTVKVGSEVNRLLLEVVPALPAGVSVHVHDVYFPFDHAPTVLDGDLFFWNESVLLHALLVDNARLSIEVSMSMLHHDDPTALARVFPRYRPCATPDGLAAADAEGDFPSAIYLRTG